jgi:ribosome maturation factor RimP
MGTWRQLVGVGLAFGMLHLTLIDVARGSEPTALLNPTAVKQQVGLLGVGTKVNVRLSGGKKLNGTIQEIGDSTFLVAPNGSSPTSVAYEQVAQLKLTKNTYKAKGSVDVEEARRVIAGLSVGHHIMVKTTAGQEYHGNIKAIETDSFTMLPDHTTTPVQIAYDEIRQTGPNLSKGAKIGIVVLVAVVIIAVAIIATKPWQSE